MKKAHIDALAASWKDDPLPGADAARSQDFMYDEFGLPAGGTTSPSTTSPRLCPKAEPPLHNPCASVSGQKFHHASRIEERPWG